MHNDPLLRITGLSVEFGTGAGAVRAVDRVDLEIAHGEVLGLVGESGSGKTVTSLAIPGLIEPPGRIVEGSILFDGEDLRTMAPRALRRIRGRRIGFVFQEPMSALNPVLRCGLQIAEALQAHGLPVNAGRIRELLEWVGIPAPDRAARAYPHELSGGMRQRVMIAMAVACRPQLLIADEPTTALDVTVQAQILELLDRLRRETGMAVLLISHDLGVIGATAGRVAVMYGGHVQETAPADALFEQPLHPYTQGLIAAMPKLEHRAGRMTVIPGQVPDPAAMPAGCRFAPRCPVAEARCREELPALSAVSPSRSVRCWKPGERAFESAA